MFSLLYYLHILPYPYPFVKHYFQNFFDLFKWCGSTLSLPPGGRWIQNRPDMGDFEDG